MEYIINTRLNGADILKIFVESGLHTVGNMRVNWSKPVVCVCLVTFMNWRKALLIRQSTPFVHAEHGIIEFLRINILRIRFVKIFCNYSPCSKPGYECCHRIDKIKESLKKQERRRGDDVRSLTFVFSHLYNIARPSCWKRGCFETGRNEHNRPQENYTSLSNLCSFGPSIRSFEMADWMALIELLALSDSQIGVETGNLTSFRFGEEYGFWRDLEDAEMKRDFQILKDNYNGL